MTQQTTGIIEQTFEYLPVDMLANMSARPRTEVLRRVPVVRSTWRSFSDSAVPAALTATQRSELDAYWVSLSLTGMVLVLAATPSRVAATAPKPCVEEKLLLNVVLRTRGNLLLAETPLLAEIPRPTGTVWLIDDPRITEVSA